MTDHVVSNKAIDTASRVYEVFKMAKSVSPEPKYQGQEVKFIDHIQTPPCQATATRLLKPLYRMA